MNAIRQEFNRIKTTVRRLYRFYTVLTYNQREWVRDLRSGKFKQGRGSLKTPEGYCCLGVACETYARLVPGADITAIYSLILLYRDQSLISVAQFFGLGHVYAPNNGQQILADLNDAGTSFDAIADYIVDNAEILFERTK